MRKLATAAFCLTVVFALGCGSKPSTPTSGAAATPAAAAKYQSRVALAARVTGRQGGYLLCGHDAGDRSGGTPAVALPVRLVVGVQLSINF